MFPNSVVKVKRELAFLAALGICRDEHSARGSNEANERRGTYTLICLFAHFLPPSHSRVITYCSLKLLKTDYLHSKMAMQSGWNTFFESQKRSLTFASAVSSWNLSVLVDWVGARRTPFLGTQRLAPIKGPYTSTGCAATYNEILAWLINLAWFYLTFLKKKVWNVSVLRGLNFWRLTSSVYVRALTLTRDTIMYTRNPFIVFFFCDFHIPFNTICFPHKILPRTTFNFSSSLGVTIAPLKNWKQNLYKILWENQVLLWGAWKSQIQ